MNTATAETGSPAEIEFYKAEIRRLKAGIERDLAEMEENQRRAGMLGAETDARPERTKQFIKKYRPTADVLS